ncbi:MAG: MFS transporter [Pelolinea sp.]|nr:MFS transporter [Pelolinea sp.]
MLIKPAVAGIAILVGKIWEYINDPLIDRISDRARTKWGRRRPFLLFGAIPFALAFIMMWYKPPFSSSVGLTLYYAVAYVVFLCVMAGIGVGAAHVLPWSILPDAIEWDEYQTGGIPVKRLRVRLLRACWCFLNIGGAA